MQPMSFGREVASVLLKVVAVILTIVILIGFVSIASYTFTSISDGSCNIAVMPIEGVIMPYGNGVEYAEFATTPRDVREFIDLLSYEVGIDGVLFEINSPGGAPVASELMAAAVAELELPTIALVGDIAASGGYMVAAAADTVIASPMSDIGSIGVTMSYLEETKKNEEEGYTFVPLSSGKFKDTGNPNKPLTDEERSLLQGQLTEVHDYFVSLVSTWRSLDVSTVAALADGSTMTGTKALEQGLVDRLGGRSEAKAAFAAMLGTDVGEVSFCEYTPLELL